MLILYLLTNHLLNRKCLIIILWPNKKWDCDMVIIENDNNNNIKLKKKAVFATTLASRVYSSGLLSLSEGKNIHVLHDDRCNIK